MRCDSPGEGECFAFKQAANEYCEKAELLNVAVHELLVAQWDGLHHRHVSYNIVWLPGLRSVACKT